MMSICKPRNFAHVGTVVVTLFSAWNFMVVYSMTEEGGSSLLRYSLELVRDMNDETCSVVITDTQVSSSSLENGNLNVHSLPTIMLSPTIADGTLGKAISLCHLLIVLVHDNLELITFMQRKVLQMADYYIIVSSEIGLITEHHIFKEYLNSVYVIGDGQSQPLVLRRKNPFMSNLEKLKIAEIKTMDDLFPPTTNFNGHKIRASAFNNRPYSIINLETNRHGGIEYNIARTLTKSLNLEMVVQNPTDGEKWGREEPPGSGNFSGLIGDLKQGYADLGWANLYVNSRRLAFMSFSEWYDIQSVCMLVPMPEPYAKILALILPFDLQTWILIAMTFLVINLFFVFCFIVLNRRELTLFGYLMMTMEITVGKSSPLMTRLRSDFARSVAIIMALGMFVLTSTYSGTLISFLTVSVVPSPINDYTELLQSHQDGMTVTTCCDQMIRGLRESLVPAQRQLAKTIIDHSSNYESFINMTKGDYATVNMYGVLNAGVRNHLLDESGVANYHIGTECIMPLRIALGMAFRSPLKSSVDMKMRMLKEAGLISKYQKDGENSLGVWRTAKTKEARRDEPLTLRELAGVFYVLLALLAGGLVSLMVEVVVRGRPKSL